MKFLIGRKIGMTQLFDEDGTVTPVTVIEAEPNKVVQKKTVETDGYNGVQIAAGKVKEKNVNKPLKGHFDKANVEYKRYLNEFRTDDVDSYNVGDEMKVDLFAKGEFVDITGTSKGKGTQGVVTRHGFGRGRETHGSKFHRMPGGMGAASYPGKVFKNHRMAGKTGNERVTVQHLLVVRVDVDKNLIFVKGAVPGPKKGKVIVKSTVKSGK
ncbi:large subunit ribosomal protein L3 [Peptoniphilus koenoeneniae]|uniref:Large ribosomal subunit protein uL3 n=1 Tax=Peptoniphilus koenoeneniae TaxID=507751 RepID=A0ABU0AV83_9FIRM|nr:MULTISPECIES: 50S ribosomal protein L3 [Peptoniphilus]ERT57578.1 50S ribosomal protein L3 [Peptoniphilus sp. BV3C26]MDQ0274716.1 large subunit ribosomal protein L3 [Peptoniphilus koenoeneniae]